MVYDLGDKSECYLQVTTALFLISHHGLVANSGKLGGLVANVTGVHVSSSQMK